MSSFEQNNNDLSLADIHHEVLLQLEAIIFASEAPVSIARLKKHLIINITNNSFVSFYNSLPFYNMAVPLS